MVPSRMFKMFPLDYLQISISSPVNHSETSSTAKFVITGVQHGNWRLEDPLRLLRKREFKDQR